MIKQTYCYLLERFESLIWSVESSVFLYKMIFKSILPLIHRITNTFLLILLYKGHAIKDLWWYCHKKVWYFVLEWTINDKNIHNKNWYSTRHLLNKMCVKVSNCEPTVYVQSYLCICAKPEYVSIKDNVFICAESRFCVISGIFIWTLISYAKST